jgi:hypothetical protein
MQLLFDSSAGFPGEGHPLTMKKGKRGRSKKLSTNSSGRFASSSSEQIAGRSTARLPKRAITSNHALATSTQPSKPKVPSAQEAAEIAQSLASPQQQQQQQQSQQSQAQLLSLSSGKSLNDIIVEQASQTLSQSGVSRAAQRKVPERTQLTQKEQRLANKVARETVQQLVRSNARARSPGRSKQTRGTKRGSARDLANLFPISSSTAWRWATNAKV